VPPEHKELSQMAATSEALAGAVPKNSTAPAAVTKAVMERDLIPIGMLQARTMPHDFILDQSAHTVCSLPHFNERKFNPRCVGTFI
jgi:hypothetical protein